MDPGGWSVEWCITRFFKRGSQPDKIPEKLCVFLILIGIDSDFLVIYWLTVD